MALKKRTRPYEILIRFDEDGTPHAAYFEITEIVEDGKVMSGAQIGAAQEVNTENVAGLIADKQVELLALNAKLIADLAAKPAEEAVEAPFDFRAEALKSDAAARAAEEA